MNGYDEISESSGTVLIERYMPESPVEFSDSSCNIQQIERVIIRTFAGVALFLSSTCSLDVHCPRTTEVEDRESSPLVI